MTILQQFFFRSETTMAREGERNERLCKHVWFQVGPEIRAANFTGLVGRGYFHTIEESVILNAKRINRSRRLFTLGVHYFTVIEVTRLFCHDSIARTISPDIPTSVSRQYYF